VTYARLRFALLKENADTMQVAAEVARCLGVRRVGLAGTKDKRAVTTQWATADGVSRSKLEETLLRESGRFRLGNVTDVSRGLELGDLRGNRFEIALRGCEGNERLEEVASEACGNVERVGFVNYFGLQRFGAGGASNAVVGKQLLDGHWQEAVDSILAVRSVDDLETRRAKRLYFSESPSSESVAAAARALPRQMHVEKTVLFGLAKALQKRRAENAYEAALGALPKNQRVMYLHAHQSKVWNLVASSRLTRGTRVLPGDLVLRSDVVSSRDLSVDSASVHVVDATTLGDYSIYDVVLPLPGHAVQYPSFDGAHDAYAATDALPSHRYLRSDSLPSLAGAYRRLLVKPTHFHWRLVPYASSYDQLLDTDLDRLASSVLEDDPPSLPKRKAASSGRAPPQKRPKHDDDETKKHTALVVGFELPASSYATVCLRELTKSSMAKSAHVNLRTWGAADEPPSQQPGRSATVLGQKKRRCSIM